MSIKRLLFITASQKSFQISRSITNPILKNVQKTYLKASVTSFPKAPKSGPQNCPQTVLKIVQKNRPTNRPLTKFWIPLPIFSRVLFWNSRENLISSLLPKNGSKYYQLVTVQRQMPPPFAVWIALEECSSFREWVRRSSQPNTVWLSAF